MPLNALANCSQALLKIGAQPVAAFEEGTAEAEIAANLYPSVRDALLVAHPWGFATGQASLPRLSTVPVADYAYAFQLPAGLLRVISAGCLGHGAGLPYRINEDRLFADTQQVVLSYLFRSDESRFPPHFVAALVARLAAEFCLPLTENSSRADLLYRLALAEQKTARLVDSQQDTPRALLDFPLLVARG